MEMIDSSLAVLIALGTAGLFVVAGVLFIRKRKLSAEDYLVARNSAGGNLATATLVASVIGAWVLFSPAEAGTWAGLMALIGYGLGQAAPLAAFVIVGPRMRSLMPEGHSLIEYVWHRYGKTMYLFVLGVTVFYMFVFLSAELTGIAKAVNLLSGANLGLTALIVGLLTVTYTAYGGLRASIFTDGIQFTLILPLLVLILVAAATGLGGLNGAFGPVSSDMPELLSLTYRPGLEFGATLIIAILAANMFHQGFWQRIYACKDDIALRRGFALSGIVVVPVILLAGILGIWAVGEGLVDDPSVAVFSLVEAILPTWAGVAVLILALVLVMSSMDTLLNGIASTVTSDLARIRSQMNGDALIRSSRGFTVILVLPAIFIASQGYSVLYMFLIADMVCAAAVVPVFWGLYSRKFDGRSAVGSSIIGLILGTLFFPTPAAPYLTGWIIDINWATQLIVSFGLALGGSTLASLVMSWSRRDIETDEMYDFSMLKKQVRLISG